MTRADHDLLQQYLDGGLSIAESSAVEGRLKSEAAFADAYLFLARSEAILTEWAQAASVLPLASQPLTELVPAQSRRRGQFIGGLTLAASAVAAVLLFAIFAPPPLPSPSEPADAAAYLASVQGQVYVETSKGRIPARAGLTLRPGDELFTHGEDSSVDVDFPDQSEVSLAGDTRVKLVATGGFNRVGGAADKRLFFTEGRVTADALRPATKPLILETDHAVAVVKDAKAHLAVADGKTLVEWEAGKQVQFTRKADKQSIAIRPETFAYATLAPKEPVWEAQPLPARVTKPRAVVKEPAGSVAFLAVTPDERTLITAAGGVVKFWDLNTNQARRTIEAHPKKNSCMTLSADGLFLATGGDDRTLRVWSVLTGDCVASWSGLRAAPTAAAFSADGRLVAASVDAGRDLPDVRIWNLATQQEQTRLSGFRGAVACLVFSPNQQLLMAGCRDGAIKCFDVQTGKVETAFVAHDSEIRTLALSPNGMVLATGARDGTIRLWDAANWDPLGQLNGHSAEVRSLAFGRDGGILASGSADRTARIWDLADQVERVTYKVDNPAVAGVHLLNNGRTLLTASLDRAIRFWDVPWPDSDADTE